MRVLVTLGQSEFSHRNFEIFVFEVTVCTYNASHRLDMVIGVSAYERAYQTVY